MTLLGRPLRWPVLVVSAVLLVVAVLVYAVRSEGSGPGYRLATAATGDVEQVLSVGGTVDAARRADLAFATGGTVARVVVAQGERVKAGQIVATLDTTSLRAAVIDAEAAVAKAKAQLAADRTAQTQAVSAATTPSSSGASASTGPGSSAGSGSGKPASGSQGSGNAAVLATLKKQQAAVLSAQATASKAIAEAKRALAVQGQTCAAATEAVATGAKSGAAKSSATTATTTGSGAGAAQTDSAADSTTDPATDPASADGGTEGDASGAGDVMDACTTALRTVSDRQDDVAAAQDALAKALETLAATLTKALGTTASQSMSQGDGQSSGSAGQSAAASGGMGRTVTAATLASDQASIDQAEADLVEAKQALSRATLRATRPGRVAAVQVGKGDSLSAGEVVAVVVGGKAVTVTASVSQSQVGRIQSGQAVRVTTPGSDASAAGTVTAVGLVGDSSAGGTTYPVTVLVEDPGIALPAGSRAMVAITVGLAENVVTVPVSAVSRTGETAVVRVEKDGAIVSKRVTLGAVGATSVAVTDGVSAGDRVVLAELGRSITGASDTLDTRVSFSGGPGGGAFPGGGMPPGMQRGGR